MNPAPRDPLGFDFNRVIGLLLILFLGDILCYKLKDQGHGNSPWIRMTERPFAKRLGLSDCRYHFPRFLHSKAGSFGDCRKRFVEGRR